MVHLIPFRHRLPSWIALLTLPVGASALENPDPYLLEVKPLLERKCFACHGPLKQKAGLRLDTGTAIRHGGDSGPAVVPGDWRESLLVQRITAPDESDRMPPEGNRLTSSQVERIKAWITRGAVSPDDEQPRPGPLDHWAFHPPTTTRQPASPDSPGIDGFIRNRLREAGLDLAPPADRATLIRRLFLDLHGLPPTPERIEAFLNDTAPDAYPRLVEEVLASPRYGERWGQHWLDVVRYADTHGYEVNTPRPNAWPYRDYVIQAFNDDKPYDRFVFEQLAGDSVGQDPATGFLVAAAVLLPGQIGKDEASKRLARQDALDEIVVGTSATFLGLTVGCARCHDHKFDPISQRDYYAMQACFAGVEYGDREFTDPAREQRLAQAGDLAARIAELRTRLQRFEPVAFTERTLIIDDEDAERTTSLRTKNGHGENPDGTEPGFKGDTGGNDRLPNLGRGRYTWWDNTPGVDVFTYNPGVAGRYRLWISWGVHGSGVHTRDARYVLDDDGRLDTLDDQREIARVNQHRFAYKTSGETPQQPLWSGLHDAGVHDWTASTRLVLRGGETQSGITADVIVLQETAATDTDSDSDSDSEHVGLGSHPRLRAPVNPRRNVERFAPIKARRIRFTSEETVDNNRHEPCLDELEAFGPDDPGRNLALATAGARATSSGNIAPTERHQLEHINDGRYGNGRSWISDEKGRGWVEIELAEPTHIDRVVWGRDRDGKYADRLAVRYLIQVSLEPDRWVTVASSADRAPHGSPDDGVGWLARDTAGDRTDLAGLIDELRRLEALKHELETPTMVFAGTFREPDTTRLLIRGDAEQPADPVDPAVPAVLGSIALPTDASEQQRRIALARWIVDPSNPLTARVMVNRVWQYHFGRGLVETSSDFGLNGALPSHPDLLDWLADHFIQRGWSVKHLHRLILLSETYRQSSRIDPRAQAVDGDCRLLWRYPSRRLEAESIRDSLLAVSGELNLQMSGPGYDFFKTRGGLSGFPPVDTFGPDRLRRMIYAHKIRMEPVPVFGAFDCPDAGQATPQRSRSTTAIQALNLFNSPFVMDRATAFALRLRAEAGDEVSDQVARAFQIAFGRPCTAEEAELCSETVRDHGLVTLCRAMFNTNEFLFIP